TNLPSAPYTLVLGSHPVVLRVLEELSRAGDPALLLAPQRPPGLPAGIVFHQGDVTDERAIQGAHPANACRALIACTSDSDTLVIAVALHHLSPDLEVFALTQAPSVARALSELGVSHTLASDELIGHTLAKSLETPGAGHLLLQLVNTEAYRLVEQPVAGELVAQRLSAARGRSGALVLGIARANTVDLGVMDDPV